MNDRLPQQPSQVEYTDQIARYDPDFVKEFVESRKDRKLPSGYEIVRSSIPVAEVRQLQAFLLAVNSEFDLQIDLGSTGKDGDGIDGDYQTKTHSAFRKLLDHLGRLGSDGWDGLTIFLGQSGEQTISQAESYQVTEIDGEKEEYNEAVSSFQREMRELEADVMPERSKQLEEAVEQSQQALLQRVETLWTVNEVTGYSEKVVERAYVSYGAAIDVLEQELSDRDLYEKKIERDVSTILESRAGQERIQAYTQAGYEPTKARELAEKEVRLSVTTYYLETDPVLMEQVEKHKQLQTLVSTYQTFASGALYLQVYQEDMSVGSYRSSDLVRELETHIEDTPGIASYLEDGSEYACGLELGDHFDRERTEQRKHYWDLLNSTVGNLPPFDEMETEAYAPYTELFQQQWDQKIGELVMKNALYGQTYQLQQLLGFVVDARDKPSFSEMQFSFDDLSIEHVTGTYQTVNSVEYGGQQLEYSIMGRSLEILLPRSDGHIRVYELPIEIDDIQTYLQMLSAQRYDLASLSGLQTWTAIEQYIEHDIQGQMQRVLHRTAPQRHLQKRMRLLVELTTMEQCILDRTDSEIARGVPIRSDGYLESIQIETRYRSIYERYRENNRPISTRMLSVLKDLNQLIQNDKFERYITRSEMSTWQYLQTNGCLAALEVGDAAALDDALIYIAAETGYELAT